MSIALANAVLIVAAIYAAVGLIVGIGFIVTGIGTVDHAARGAPWSFRILILPAAAALWPLVLGRWARRLWGRSP